MEKKPWCDADMRELQRLVGEKTPTRVIGLKMGRTPAAVCKKAASEGISLKPANQSPHSGHN